MPLNDRIRGIDEYPWVLPPCVSKEENMWVFICIKLIIMCSILLGLWVIWSNYFQACEAIKEIRDILKKK